MEEWNEGTIVVKNVKCKRSVADHGVVWKECLNMCRLRVALKTSAEKIRNNVVSILSYCITHNIPTPRHRLQFLVYTFCATVAPFAPFLPHFVLLLTQIAHFLTSHVRFFLRFLRRNVRFFLHFLRCNLRFFLHFFVFAFSLVTSYPLPLSRTVMCAGIVFKQCGHG